MKKYLFLFILAGFVFSCTKKHEEVVPPYQLNAYNPYFMIYYKYSGVILDTDKIKLEYYPDAKLKKRVGDIVDLPVPPYPYSHGFIGDIIDTFTYTDNMIRVHRVNRGASNGLNHDIFTRTYYMENGRVVKMVMQTPDRGYFDDSTFYFYNSKGLLDSTVCLGRFKTLTKKYYFDSNGNLEKVLGNYHSYYLTEEHFSGYDNSDNPLKALIGLEEMFYRSLSRNNFTFYSMKKIDTDKSPSYYTEMQWDLQYDGNNLPIFLLN